MKTDSPSKKYTYQVSWDLVEVSPHQGQSQVNGNVHLLHLLLCQVLYVLYFVHKSLQLRMKCKLKYELLFPVCFTLMIITFKLIIFISQNFIQGREKSYMIRKILNLLIFSVSGPRPMVLHAFCSKKGNFQTKGRRWRGAY